MIKDGIGLVSSSASYIYRGCKARDGLEMPVISRLIIVSEAILILCSNLFSVLSVCCFSFLGFIIGGFLLVVIFVGLCGCVEFFFCLGFSSVEYVKLKSGMRRSDGKRSFWSNV